MSKQQDVISNSIPMVLNGGCCQNTDVSKALVIEYLFLDNLSCDRCIETDAILDDVLSVLVPALELAGFSIKIQKIEVSNKTLAQKYQFLSSPTIRVNGMDIFQTIEENVCGCCSDISGTNVTCRTFTHNGISYEVPPSELLANAILTTVFNKQTSNLSREYTMPENLKDFFEGKKSKSCCSSSSECCNR